MFEMPIRPAAKLPHPPILPAYPGHGARLASLLALEPRAEIEAAIEVLLATLDARDDANGIEGDGDEGDRTGSCEEDTPLHRFGDGDGYPGDCDDAEDDDPAGTPIDFAEGDDARFNYRPRYGKNQTRRPLNCKAMNRDYQEKVMAGLRDEEIACANRAPKGFLPGGAA